MSATRCAGIVIVEDDQAIRETLSYLLEAEGHQVTALTNGREAIDFLESHEAPCFVLLDLMMPVMDGWEFLKIREKSPRLLAIPVVVNSANVVSRPENENTLQIRKPFELESLVRIVSRFCKPHPSAPHELDARS